MVRLKAWATSYRVMRNTCTIEDLKAATSECLVVVSEAKFGAAVI